MRRTALLVGLALCAFPGLARAELLTWSQRFRADFELNLLGDTPLNPGPETGFIAFQAFGTLTISLDPSLNDPSQPTTVAFTGFSGVLPGVSPPPFLPFSISPNVQFLGGELTNIVRNSKGEVISAHVDNLNSLWEMIAPGGARLYGDVGLPFSGDITSIPFRRGTVIGGAAEFNVLLDDGQSGILVAIGRNRTLTAVPVPEPSSAALLGIGTLALIFVAKRRIVRS